jgi:tripartite-type tricarboxylate transporter receptor subunit TctC
MCHRRATSSEKLTARRTFARCIMGLAATLGALTVAAPPVCAKSGFPNRPVRIIVAFAPGGITDIIARLVGQKLGDATGQSFAVENRGGAAGTLGAKIVSDAAPDGYTLLVTTTAIAINAAVVKGAVDPRTQLTPIAIAATAPMIFAANHSVTSPNLMDYVRHAKNGRITFSSSGIGTAEDLTAEYIFKAVPGIDATHVPYSGGAEVLNAVLGNQVDLAATTVPPALPFLKSGSLRVLASVSHRRLAMLPDVPTIGELGFPDLENPSWIGFFAPPDLPGDIAKSLNSMINKALARPDVTARLTDLGFLLQPQEQAETVATMKQEVAKWKEIVEKTGFNPN